MDPAGLRPLGVGEILDVAIKIYRSRFLVLMKAAAIVLAPVFVLSAVIGLSVTNEEDDIFLGTEPGATPDIDASEFWAFVAAALLIVILFYIASQVATGACFKVVSGAYLNEEPDWRASLRFARSRLGSLLWLSFLSALLLILAVLAFLVPAIYLWGAWAVATPVLLFDDVRGLSALRRSRQLVKGRWWPTVGVLVLVFILTSLVQGVITGLLTGVVSVSGNEVASALADAVGQTAGAALTTPLSAAVVTVLYFDLRVRKEGFDLELMARRLGGEPDGPDVSDAGPPSWPPPPDA